MKKERADSFFVWGAIAVGLGVLALIFVSQYRWAGTTARHHNDPLTRPSELSVEKSAAETASSWNSIVESITSEDRIAWIDRIQQRQTFARMQRFLENSSVTGEKLKELEQLLVAKQLLDFDLNTVARKEGISTESDGYVQLRNAEKEKIDHRIRSLVGESYYKEIEESSRTLEDRPYVIGLVGEAYLQGVPLTSEQRSLVNEILAWIERGDMKTRMSAPPDPGYGLMAHDLRAFEELKGVLTPAQLEILRQVRLETSLYGTADQLKREKRGTGN